MLRNYFTVAVRVLLRKKIYVAINLLSLGFALACCLMTYLNYDYRATFDGTHTEARHVYRINSTRSIDGGTQPWAVTPLPLAEEVVKNFTGAGAYTRLFGAAVSVKHNGSVFNEQLNYTDKNTFVFFNLPFKHGSAADFNSGKSLVLSEAFALKYFGSEEPLGKELTVLDSQGKEDTYTVRGVLAKVPANSSFQMDMVTSFEHLFTSGRLRRNDWSSQDMVTTFVEVKEESRVKNLAQQLQPYAELHNRGHADWKIAGFSLQPFRDVAFSSDIDMSGYVHGSALNANPRGVGVIVPALMSLLILLITVFNFTNITIAFASGRLKEIGIRKVLGGVRPQLIVQFLTENLIMCTAASLVAIVCIAVLLPVFNAATGMELQLGLGTSTAFWVFLIVVPVGTAIISGLYPAVYISSFQPVTVLKGRTKLGSSSRLTRVLLTAQFSICCLALTVGILLTQNAYYQEEADYGYDIEAVAVTQLQESGAYTALSNAIRQNPKVRTVAGAAQQIGDASFQVTVTGETQEIKAQVAHVGGEEYLNALGIKLTDGRHFHPGKGPDHDGAVLVNQTLVSALGLRQPVGKQIKFDSTYFTIVGVVADYKEYGLHGLVPPCILRPADTDEFEYLVVRADPADMNLVEENLRTAWQQIVPGKPYNGFLQTELIEKERSLNDGFKTVAFFLALVTMLLSASGLFALVSLNIIKRTKEIGMRKLLGATHMQVVGLISKDFVWIIFIAFAIGSALGYLLISKMVFKFIYPYHSPIGPGAFLTALLILVVSCILTVGLKVLKAVTSKPIDALKVE